MTAEWEFLWKRSVVKKFPFRTSKEVIITYVNKLVKE